MFHLEFEFSSLPVRIDHPGNIVSLGSCFADEMGHKLVENKFDCLVNPFGTLFNPMSLAQMLSGQIDQEAVTEHQQVFYHWQAHGDISATSREDLLATLNETMAKTSEKLKKADWLLLTLGSAFAYRLKEEGRIVANCHKKPQSLFDKTLLQIDEMYDALLTAIQQIRDHNPELQVLMSVSPVRHYRDGIIENNRSKARLLEVVHRLSGKDGIHYFPAYEILIDELRDYRFYARNRVHPSAEAVDYVWENFCSHVLSDEAKSFLASWQPILQAVRHQPRHPQTAEHQQFLKSTINKIRNLPAYVDTSKELTLLEKQTIN